MLRPSAPAASIIQFLGGIHEIYFPYVLMKPRLILAVMAGGASGVLTFLVTGAGLVATPAPGSIFAYLAVTPKGGWFGVLAGILVAAGVSFLVASALMGFGRANGDEPQDAGPDATAVDPDTIPGDRREEAVATAAPARAERDDKEVQPVVREV